MPQNLWGNPNGDSYFVFGPNVSSSGSAYNCVTPSSKINNALIPDPANFTSDEAYFIATLALYRFLDLNDSIKGISVPLTNFYNSHSGNSVREFSKVEDYLMANDLVNATTVVSGITPTNTMESNYVLFYNLYISYASNRFEHTTSGDQSDLETLASGCPGTDGPCVHQARALHNAVYNSADLWATCSGSGARTAPLSIGKTRAAILQLYPNPAQNQVIITGVPFDKWITIEIADLSGRIVMFKTVKADGIIAKLDLELINGAYLVKINYGTNEHAIKKLLIAR